jgi:regulatory protein
VTGELRGAKTEEERALELAYRTLSSRDRTVAEVRAFLERKGIGEAASEHAVAELTAAGFLDDARYARLFTEDKRGIERWGSERIERDLRRRGVPADLVESALAGTDRDEEMATALGLLGEKLPPPQTDRERDRAWRILVRKGYEPELAYEAVRAHGRDVERA